MLTAEGPKVLEFNVRFGDPEAQVVLPRLTSDLARMLSSAAGGGVDGPARFSSDAAVTVVVAAPGYPQATKTGQVIDDLEVAASTPGALVFHAGTRERDGRLLTSGGRVLSVTGLGPDIDEARRISYHAIDSLYFEGMQVRRDIAAQPTTR